MSQPIRVKGWAYRPGARVNRVQVEVSGGQQGATDVEVSEESTQGAAPQGDVSPETPPETPPR